MMKIICAVIFSAFVLGNTVVAQVPAVGGKPKEEVKIKIGGFKLVAVDGRTAELKGSEYSGPSDIVVPLSKEAEKKRDELLKKSADDLLKPSSDRRPVVSRVVITDTTVGAPVVLPPLVRIPYCRCYRSGAVPVANPWGYAIPVGLPTYVMPYRWYDRYEFACYGGYRWRYSGGYWCWWNTGTTAWCRWCD